MKPIWTIGLTLLLILLSATALADAAVDTLERTAVPMAQENDRGWQVNKMYSPAELAALVRACEENGIDLSENHEIILAVRNREGYDEAEAILAVCRSAYGRHISLWSPEQRQRVREMMADIGRADDTDAVLSAADGMTAEEARSRFLAFSLTREEAVRLAAAEIRAQAGHDVPLEDPEQYRVQSLQQIDAAAGWQVSFISRTPEWGYCSAFADDETRLVTVLSADTDGLTADSILARYRGVYGWYTEWDTALWAEIANRAAGLPAETMTGRLTKATPWIDWHDGLLTREQAAAEALRQAGIRRGSADCACLIDAEPNPVWKLRIIPRDGSYGDPVAVEIDAVTGGMTDLVLVEADRPDIEPAIHMITLRRTWSKLEYEENGPLYIARLAVLHRFADSGPDWLETESLPIFDLRCWVPDINGGTVRFRSRWSDLPDYEVTLEADGMAAAARETETSGTEPVPWELSVALTDEWLYGVDFRVLLQAQERYGINDTLWPLETQMAACPDPDRSMPREGEMSREEAVAYARAQLPPDARAAVEDAVIGAVLYRIDEGKPDEITRWTIFFYEDPSDPRAWRVTFLDKRPEGVNYPADVKAPWEDGYG